MVKWILEKIIDKLEKLSNNIDSLKENIEYYHDQSLHIIEESINTRVKASSWRSISDIIEVKATDDIDNAPMLKAGGDGFCWVRVTPKKSDGWLTVREFNGPGDNYKYFAISKFWVAGENQKITAFFPVQNTSYIFWCKDCTAEVKFYLF